MEYENEIWLDLFNYCFEVICTNYDYILQYCLPQFIELKHFKNPIPKLYLSEEDEMKIKFG